MALDAEMLKKLDAAKALEPAVGGDSQTYVKDG